MGPRGGAGQLWRRASGRHESERAYSFLGTHKGPRSSTARRRNAESKNFLVDTSRLRLLPAADSSLEGGTGSSEVAVGSG